MAQQHAVAIIIRATLFNSTRRIRKKLRWRGFEEIFPIIPWGSGIDKFLLVGTADGETLDALRGINGVVEIGSEPVSETRE